jgi:hypothetical protein
MRNSTSLRRLLFGSAFGAVVCAGLALYLFRGRIEPEPISLAAETGSTHPSSSIARSERLAAPLAPRNESDVTALVAEIRRLATTGGNPWMLLERLGGTRPATAIELALDMGRGGEEKDSWVTELTRAWASRDPQAAWDWLGQQTSRMDQLAGGSLIGVVLQEMAAQAPQRVIENVDTLLRRERSPDALPALVVCQHGLLVLLAHGHLELARSAVENWVENPQAQPIDASALNVVAAAIAETSWADAWIWLETLPPSPDRASAFTVLASKWADHDPTAALSLAETLGTENGQFAAIRSVFADWAERDGSRAGDWLSGYIDRAKSESEIDQLIGSFVAFSTGLQREPALALHWVGLMRNSAQQAALTERVILRWGQRDLATAIRYVETAADLPGPQRQQLKASLSALAAESDPLTE